jgi:histidinol-phosphate/aromatic aminotransferase/cobyric acid decarboxylase-like protein
MRFDNQFEIKTTKKWDLARGENLTKYGFTYAEYDPIHEFLSNYYDIPKGYMCLTSGAEEAVRICLADPNSPNRVHFTPTWGLVPVLNNLYGENITEIEVEIGHSEFVYNTIKLEKHLQTCNMLYIATPNASTGSTMDVSVLIDFIKRYPDTIFIVDETYYQFNGYRSILSYVPKFDNLVVIRNYSKAHGLASKRFGFYATKNKRFIDARPASPCSEDTIPLVLESYKNVDNSVKMIMEGKKYLEKVLKDDWNCKVFNIPANYTVFEGNSYIEDRLKKISKFHYVTIEGKKFIKITAMPVELAIEFEADLNAY